MLEPETESEEEEEERIIQVIYKSVYQNGNAQEHKTSTMQWGEKVQGLELYEKVAKWNENNHCVWTSPKNIYKQTTIQISLRHWRHE